MSFKEVRKMTNTIFHYLSNRLLMSMARALKENNRLLSMNSWEAIELKKELDKRAKAQTRKEGY